MIRKIGAAQKPDGYLYTARTIDPVHPHSWAGKTRWERERELSHELYNAGHLFEAAAAHYYATGKKTLLNIALKNADLNSESSKTPFSGFAGPKTVLINIAVKTI